MERDGVTVEKSVEPDDFPVPTIVFVIRSMRDVPVNVQLTDEVPDDFETEEIGFHSSTGRTTGRTPRVNWCSSGSSRSARTWSPLESSEVPSTI